MARKIAEREEPPEARPPPKKRTKNQKKPPKPPAEKARKIRVYPTKEEKETLLRWIGTARWTYNECLRLVESERVPRKKKDLRARVLNNDAVDAMNKPWLRGTPYDMRDEAMNDLLKAYKAAFARKRNDDKAFKIRPRSRKHLEQESVVVHAKYWKAKHGQYAFMRRMRAAEPLPDDLVYDTRLLYRRRIGEFYLCVLSPIVQPQPLFVAPEPGRRDENQVPPPSAPPPRRAIALDPGVRTFLTGYDPDGRACEWGRGDVGRVYRLCHALDKLTSRAFSKGVDHHRRWRMRRAMGRIRGKIRDLVDDLHRRAAKWLCQEHAFVLLPEFETSRMIRRGQRRLRSKTARAMATWSHYRFRQRLQSKTREYPGCRVVLVDEAYTSKTCGRCGRLNDKLGGSKVFRCAGCGLVADRDLHAARNIMLRYLSDFPSGRLR